MHEHTFTTVIKVDNLNYYGTKYRNHILAWDGAGKAWALKPIKEAKEESVGKIGIPNVHVEYDEKGVKWERAKELDHPLVEDA